MRTMAIVFCCVLLTGCWTTLRPGRCDHTSDCAPGEWCNLDPTPQGNGRCVAMIDGGTGGVAGQGSMGSGGGQGSGGAGGGGGELVGTGGRGGGSGGMNGSGGNPPVQCSRDLDCSAGQPACSMSGSCVACNAVSRSVCAGRDSTKPVCGTSGACVECGTDNDCHDASKPFCGAAGACVPCSGAAAGACAGRDSTKPVCGTSGACVECGTSSDCASSARPRCSDTNTCVPCSTDTDCVRFSPGVCMAHQDGRCASDAETIVAENTAGCVTANPGGTISAPFCSMQSATLNFSGTRDLVVVRGTVDAATVAIVGGSRQLTIVGQFGGTIAGGVNPGVRLGGGDLYVRDLKLANGSSTGAQAGAGSTLRLDHVVVDRNAGGGVLLDGAGFVIHNTTVTNNGPGMFGPAPWGGILTNNPPAAGPKQLDQLTVQSNSVVGITCSGAIQGTGVLVSGNSGIDIASSCGFMSCGTASSTCGAMQ